SPTPTPATRRGRPAARSTAWRPWARRRPHEPSSARAVHSAFRADPWSPGKAECTELETEVSFVRRLAQGRIDILDAERDRRASGGSLEDLIGSLSKILADEGPRPTP